jgi:hypothetical protein
MTKTLRRFLKFLIAMSTLGVCTAFVGLAAGHDSVYWAGLLLAAPLYLGYVLPMALFLFGTFLLAAIAIIADDLGIGRR